MNIFLNGQQHAVETSTTLAALLTYLQLTDKRIAVELNREMVPRSSFAQTLLQSGDCVEIVHAIGGG